jgi:hypothetical protein
VSLSLSGVDEVLPEANMSGMTAQEILKLINGYIGITPDGYLNDFSYRTHEEFYPMFCDLNINPNDFKGSTRARFQEIVRTSAPGAQAKIIRGILAKCPPEPGHQLRTEATADYLRATASRLEGLSGVGSHTPKITSEVVERAIADVEHLIASTGATSGVDRVHTMLHGYMKAVCDDQGIAFAGEATIVALFKLIREQHPSLQSLGARSQDITLILKMMGSIMDSLNPIRNNASMAHPKELLDPPEASLVINVARTILKYIDTKLTA